MDDIEAQAFRAVIEERISELWSYRNWWRINRRVDWPQERHDLETELRALVRLARQARKASPDLAAGDHFVGMPR